MESYDYKGWKIPTNLRIFARKTINEYKGYKCPQAMIASSDKADAIETAKRWASHKYSEYSDEDYIEYNIENKDIEFELLDSANNSSQGGKLSFWNCLISKDDMKVIIGISSDILIGLLRNNDFSNGKCKSKVIMARYKNQWGALTENMNEYSEAIDDINTNLKFENSKKTTKWKQGVEYFSKTRTDIYLYNLYKWYEISEETKYYWSRSKDILSYKNPQKGYLVFPEYLYRDFNKLSDFIKHYEQSNKGIEDISCLFASPYYFEKKLSARVEGKEKFKIDVTTKELELYLEKYREFITEKYLNSDENSCWQYRDPEAIVNAFAFSFDKDKKPIIPDKVIEKLKKNKCVFFDMEGR